jgi:hypothetical protein
MNCESLRKRLLVLPDPAAMPDALAQHLDACSGCQAWHQLLVRVEAGIVATAPAARSGRLKRPLIARFRNPVASGSKSNEAATVALPARPRQPLGEKLARLWPAGIVAAALLIGVLVWASLRNKPDGGTVAALPPDPFLEQVVLAKVKFDSADNVPDRLAALDVLERNVHREATEISKISPGADMESLARMYDSVVVGPMIENARLLGPDERKAVLPKYIDRLNAAAQEAHLRSLEAPAGADRPLQDIEKSALKGRMTLAQLLQGQV